MISSLVSHSTQTSACTNLDIDALAIHIAKSKNTGMELFDGRRSISPVLFLQLGEDSDGNEAKFHRLVSLADRLDFLPVSATHYDRLWLPCWHDRRPVKYYSWVTCNLLTPWSWYDSSLDMKKCLSRANHYLLITAIRLANSANLVHTSDSPRLCS